MNIPTQAETGLEWATGRKWRKVGTPAGELVGNPNRHEAVDPTFAQKAQTWGTRHPLQF